MRRLLLAILLLAASAVTALADDQCPLDTTRLSGHIAVGEFAQARKLIEVEALRPDCHCDARTTHCFRLGPEGSETLSVEEAIKALNQLEQLDHRLYNFCGKMAETNDEQRNDKLACFAAQGAEFKKTHSAVMPKSFLPFVDQVVAYRNQRIRKYFEAREESAIRAQEESPDNRRKVRSNRIARKICELLDKRNLYAERLKNSKRHNKLAKDREFFKEEFLNQEIDRLNEQIEQLKMEYEANANSSFFTTEWCEKK